MFRPLEAIIRSSFGYPGEEDGFGWQTHLPLQDTRILTWRWPPEAETCRLIIKIPYISCNTLFSNSCLVFNLNYYKSVVLDVHTPLFSILISTTGMIHLYKYYTVVAAFGIWCCGFQVVVLMQIFTPDW